MLAADVATAGGGVVIFLPLNSDRKKKNVQREKVNKKQTCSRQMNLNTTDGTKHQYRSLHVKVLFIHLLCFCFGFRKCEFFLNLNFINARVARKKN